MKIILVVLVLIGAFAGLASRDQTVVDSGQSIMLMAGGGDGYDDGGDDGG